MSGKPRHGLAHTRIYGCWADMKARCLNTNHKWYAYYGGRGITVCDEWMRFEPFAEWAFAHGYADNLTIDRIDNDKGYCPENCKWSTQHEQSINKRHPLAKSGYVGVRERLPGYFDAEVTWKMKYYYIGHFGSAEEAAKARAEFIEKLKKEDEKTIVLYEDTRNQKDKHKNIHAYCQQMGVEIIRQALNVGDYQIAGKGDISVDTKMGIPEIASNCFQEHERFRDECERALRCGIQLVVLIEEVPPDGDVSKWTSPLDRLGRPKYRFDPVTLSKVMATMTERYNVQFCFCDGRSTGKVLLEILKGENNNETQ